MEKHFDTLRFELFNPYEEKERWAVYFDLPEVDGVKIYVNDKELNAPLVELEDKEDGSTTPSNPADVYGHTGLMLARHLEDESAASYGASVCCCSDCGDEGCWGVRAKVKKCADEVIWHGFEHEHRPYTYGGLEFHFERQADEAQMKILKNWREEFGE